VGDAALRLARHRQHRSAGTSSRSEAKLMEKWFITLPDKDLAYFPDGTTEFRRLHEGRGWAQDYAAGEPRVMMEEVLRNLRHHIAKPFEITRRRSTATTTTSSARTTSGRTYG
jgi:RNA-splicing ligase RtcB